MEYRRFFEMMTGNCLSNLNYLNDLFRLNGLNCLLIAKRLGNEPWPDLVDVPTGLGKNERTSE